MKPIFNEEKEFLEEKTGLKLPAQCWRDGCTVWFDNGTLLTLKGSEIEICEQIKNITTIQHIDSQKGISMMVQDIDIWLDECGIGKEYKYILEGLHLKVNQITRSKIDPNIQRIRTFNFYMYEI